MAIRPHTENSDRFQPGAILWAGRDPKSTQKVVVGTSRTPQPGRLLVGFDPPLDRSSAEAMRGLMLFADQEALPALPEDTYWEQDLVGLVVDDLAGRRLGVISGILARAEQDLWEVDTPAGSVLLPAAKGIVVSVDLAGGRVTVDPPEGLFDEGTG